MKNLQHIIISTVIMSCLLFVLFSDIQNVFAQPHGPGSGSGGTGFENPLGNSTSSVSALLTNIINWVLGISSFLALLSLVIGGIRLITAFGNDQQVQSAKNNITWAVIGLAVIILSYAIINIVQNVLT